MGNIPAAPSPRWASRPDTATSPWIELLYPGPLQTVHGIAINPVVEGVTIHYYRDRSHPCIGKEFGCEGCRFWCDTRWKGYLGVLRPQVGRVAILELTKGAVLSCPQLLEPGADLRGLKVSVRRCGEAPNSVCKATLESVLKPIPLPKPLDIRAALLNSWGRKPQMGAKPAIPAAPGGEVPHGN